VKKIINSLGFEKVPFRDMIKRQIAYCERRSMALLPLRGLLWQVLEGRREKVD
jgi:hypothetical protein